MTSDLACETTVIASLQRYEVHGKRRVPFNLLVLLPRRPHSPLGLPSEQMTHQTRVVQVINESNEEQ
ncbi:hypothetical protein CY34DRAFT_802586 [Suillus luteus UH-Slu-Lm8-n1]|uniref:Uncharacterized protein n=1 Tax=Suillus luteus UH-Slu-Lm8-n1 TaxID=930992 RepID=A0A0D0B3I9_9AGAM|nr:hypothetical protein CY34DRAFT_802586 [Suillus luteus UH-Slu-Lm8-n1]